jgi:hypothetical protein
MAMAPGRLSAGQNGHNTHPARSRTARPVAPIGRAVISGTIRTRAAPDPHTAVPDGENASSEGNRDVRTRSLMEAPIGHLRRRAISRYFHKQTLECHNRFRHILRTDNDLGEIIVLEGHFQKGRILRKPRSRTKSPRT